MKYILIIFFIIINNTYSNNNELISNNIDNNIVEVNTENNENIIENSNIENNNIDTNDEFKKEEIKYLKDDYYGVFNSFIFGDKVIKLIQKSLILNSNKGGIKKDKERNKEIIIEENIIDQESISNIYLKSILYISKDYWSVWINDKKITNENNLDEDNEFIVKSINSKTVEIMLKVSKVKWSYMNSSGKIKNYKTLDDDKIGFDLIMHTNQTFILSKNEIIDGKPIDERENNRITNNGQSEDIEDMSEIFGDEELDLSILQ